MTRLLLVAAALVVWIAAAGVVSGAEWHVYQGAGTPIQDAIDGAEAGDTIYVHAGLYYENVNVDNRLTLIGDGADVVTVQVARTYHVFEVTTDWVNISGFTVVGATSRRNAGIYLCGADHCNLSENNISNNSHGIYLWSLSNNNTIFHNNLVNNTWANASDEGGVNQWDSGSEGNYYSNYNGTDPDGDGIGDDPHPIPGGDSIDRFPLMQPWAGDTSQKGDLNGDNHITSADAAIALAIAASGAHDDAADVSRDGSHLARRAHDPAGGGWGNQYMT